MASGSKLAVASAIGGNALVMVAKFVAAAITGSGAMFSEGIHTAADLLNQILLMIGIVRSEKVPDENFQFGYRRERFIWAMISAVGIFFLGCGFTIYHGISSLMHPHAVGDIGIAIGVLIFSLVVEGLVLYVAWRGLNIEAKERGTPFLIYIRKYADPSSVAVLLEDGAACLGIVIAMVCILLAKVTGQVYWDAIGSIIIGLLLGALAFWLIARNRALMVGPSIPKEDEMAIRQIFINDPLFLSITSFKSRMIDVSSYDVTIHVDVSGATLADSLEPFLRERFPEAATWSYQEYEGFIDEYSERLTNLLGAEIDRLEERVRTAVPQVKFIDIEPDR